MPVSCKRVSMASSGSSIGVSPECWFGCDAGPGTEGWPSTLRICRNIRGEGLQPSRARARHHRHHLNCRGAAASGARSTSGTTPTSTRSSVRRAGPSRGHVTPDEALTFRTILRRLLARAITTSASYSASGRKSAGNGRPSSWAPSRRGVPTCRQHERTAARRSRSAAACPVASRSAPSHAPRPVAFGDRARARA